MIHSLVDLPISTFSVFEASFSFWLGELFVTGDSVIYKDCIYQYSCKLWNRKSKFFLMHCTLRQCSLPNTDEDFGDEGDPVVVWGDDDAVDTLWLGFVTSIDSTNAAVAMLEESCRLLIGCLFPSSFSLVIS